MTAVSLRELIRNNIIILADYYYFLKNSFNISFGFLAIKICYPKAERIEQIWKKKKLNPRYFLGNERCNENTAEIKNLTFHLKKKSMGQAGNSNSLLAMQKKKYNIFQL